MNNTLKQLADLVRQERDATRAFEAHQDAMIAQQQKDAEKERQLGERIGAIAMQKEALLDDLADDDFEAVTVE